MRYIITLILWIIIWLYSATQLHYFDLGAFVKQTVVTKTEPISTGQIILEYLKISPVKNIATLEVLTEHSLIDDYFEDYKVLDFDTPEELDRLISQMTISGKVKVKAIYGYTSEQIAQFQNPEQRWEPKLLYYEIIENNISDVAAGIGISNNALVKRVVNVVLQWIHTKLREEFAWNKQYIQQAKESAIQKFK